MNYKQQLAILSDAIIAGEQTAMVPYIREVRKKEISPETRMAIYGEGYKERLFKVVLADYPALTHYLGEEKMTQAISAYIAATPSHHWDINLYPIGFAAFLSTHPAAALAQLESTIAEVFWLPDSAALAPQPLSDLSIEQLECMHFKPRVALRLLALDYPVDEYLQAFRERKPLAILQAGDEYLCVLRVNNEVQRIRLEAMEYRLLALLFENTPFGEALEQVDDGTLAKRLPYYLNCWMTSGFFAA